MNTLLESTTMGYRQNNLHTHKHACAELYISLDGYAINEINGFKSKTLPLDVYVLTEDMKHGQPTTHKYRYCIFKFDLNRLLQQAVSLNSDPTFQTLFIKEPILRRNGLLKTGLRIDILTSEYAIKTAQLLERETDPVLKDTLFISLISVICKHACVRTIDGQSQNYERIFATTSYMELHYAEPLELSDLAAHSGYSVRHFTRLFRLCHQISPMDYLNQIRLRHAITLLQNPELNLGKIATLCGFSGNSIFSKVFHKHFGHTPSTYRKKILSSSSITDSTLENATIIEY